MTLLRLLDFEDGGNAIVWNGRSHSPNDTVPRYTTFESSAVPLWEPQMSLVRYLRAFRFFIAFGLETICGWVSGLFCDQGCRGYWYRESVRGVWLVHVISTYEHTCIHTPEYFKLVDEHYISDTETKVHVPSVNIALYCRTGLHVSHWRQWRECLRS